MILSNNSLWAPWSTIQASNKLICYMYELHVGVIVGLIIEG